MSNFSPDPWFEEANHDPREWIVEDPATFQQVFAEVDQTDDMTPRRQEPIRQRKKTKTFRSRRKGRKVKVLERIPEDEGEESDESQPWLVGDGPGEDDDGGNYYMSGALGVRNVEVCQGVMVGGDGSGDSLVKVCEDGLEALEFGEEETSSERTARSSLVDSEAGILKEGPKKKDKGKARVKFDVEAGNTGRPCG